MAGFLSNVNMLEPYAKTQAIKTNEIQQAVDTMKLGEMREEKKRQDTPIPFKMFLKRLSDVHGESVSNAMGEDIIKMGLVDELPGADKQLIQSIKVRNIKTFNDSLNQYPENSAKYIGMELRTLEDREDELQKLAEKTTKDEEKNNTMQEIKDNQQKQLVVLRNAENNQKKIEKKQQILAAKQTVRETEGEPAVKGVFDNLKQQAKSGDKDSGYILMQYMGARNSLLKGDISAKDFVEAQRHIMEKVMGKETKSLTDNELFGLAAQRGVDGKPTPGALKAQEILGNKESYAKRIAEKPEKPTMSDVKVGFNMDMTILKNELMLAMTPEEQQVIANQPSENLLAMLLTNKFKSIQPEKKKEFEARIKEIGEKWGVQTNKVLGRKGLMMSEPTPQKASGGSLGEGDLSADGKSITVKGKTYPVKNGVFMMDGKPYRTK